MIGYSTVFESTKKTQGSTVKPLTFIDAIFQGLAPDGGLYVPSRYMDLSGYINALSADITFNELVAQMTHRLFPAEFSIEDARNISNRAFDFVPKVETLTENIMLLELFHGPSCAFKDFGASYLASIMEKRITNTDEPLTILTATSGDTGSAVAQAFHKKKNINVVILFPSQRVSPLQEKQLTGLGDNIHALEVLGSFDDCQHMVKQAFLDDTLRTQYGLSSANSINIGRLFPQAMYYIYTWNILRHRNLDNWVFCTPSGNFGNLTGGLLAKQWGLPVAHFIAATNANKVVPDFLNTGVYTPMPSLATLANAMDVGNPSNFERIKNMYTSNTNDEVSLHHNIKNVLQSVSVDDATIQKTIQEIYHSTGTFICPHTATGVHAAQHILNDTHPASFVTQHGYDKAVVLSTAHSAKFFEIIEDTTSHKPELPPRLERFLHYKSVASKIEPTAVALTNALKNIHNK